MKLIQFRMFGLPPEEVKLVKPAKLSRKARKVAAQLASLKWAEKNPLGYNHVAHRDLTGPATIPCSGLIRK